MALDDITAHLEDLDSSEMGNTHGRHSGKFVRAKKRNKKIIDAEPENEAVERTMEEQGEQIRCVL